MDEEIIIDGVDVAGCRHYDKTLKHEHVFNCYENCDLPIYCKNKNCYYKQLKRLEFELKVTKADYEASEQENAELKAENETLKEEITELEEKFLTLNGKSYSYYMTLQEIKAIAKECTTCGDCSNCKYDDHCSTDIEAQALGVCRMILNLITKAEEE